jgi:hypothetical protein
MISISSGTERTRSTMVATVRSSLYAATITESFRRGPPA